MTSFDTTNGTRGARQPGGSLMAWYNKRLAKKIRGGKGKAMGMDPLLLVTIGAKSGLTRETPVARFAGPDGSWYVVASANGAANNPAWYYNLAAHPDDVQVVIDGVETPVVARQLHGDERAEAWTRITGTMPRFAGYEGKTDREIPVIQLTPRQP